MASAGARRMSSRRGLAAAGSRLSRGMTMAGVSVLVEEERERLGKGRVWRGEETERDERLGTSKQLKPFPFRHANPSSTSAVWRFAATLNLAPCGLQSSSPKLIFDELLCRLLPSPRIGTLRASTSAAPLLLAEDISRSYLPTYLVGVQASPKLTARQKCVQ
ncbi:hypothetical protein K402DRAFT_248314 [Aulographum hederae CBS 113979]|uniref:Uncharacterized protein n=1 Tax=Aulographum hederae CBS 113979 TaxID=1176131 RepID=A0A6G1HAP7_9PEZI|nr:hypothetical protein K402DRAFT_248314 [Aulographum hederae CBS 113979]